MKRLAIPFVVASLLLTGCGDDKLDLREVLMDRCIDFGGVYFEYEATSAGSHIWCVTAEGDDIGQSVSEGDR